LEEEEEEEEEEEFPKENNKVHDQKTHRYISNSTPIFKSRSIST